VKDLQKHVLGEERQHLAAVAAAAADQLAHGLDVLAKALLGLHEVGHNSAEQNLSRRKV
jgi:hypothetical protein